MKQASKAETGESQSTELNIPPHLAENLIVAVNKLGAMAFETVYGPDYNESYPRRSPNDRLPGTIYTAAETKSENPLGHGGKDLHVEVTTGRNYRAIAFYLGEDAGSPRLVLQETSYNFPGVYFVGQTDDQGYYSRYSVHFFPEQRALYIANVDRPDISPQIILLTDGSGAHRIEKGASPNDSEYGRVVRDMGRDIAVINKLALAINESNWKIKEGY